MQPNAKNMNVDIELTLDKTQLKQIQEKVFVEKVKLLHENLLISTPANFLCATIIYTILHKGSQHTFILIWYVAVILITIFRLGLFYSYHKRPQSNMQLYAFIFGTFITALSWGIMGSLLMPQGYVVQQMIIVVIIAGITAGGIQTLEASFLASAICVIISVLPLSIWFILQNDFEYLILSISTIIYLFSLLAIAWRGYKLLGQTLILRYENVSLIENLSFSNNHLQKLRETLSEQVIRDPLTGLFNRRYLDEILPLELQRIISEKNVLCVAMMDLDYFKYFNDTNGHEAGDIVLKFTGALLRKEYRGNDIACRFGGEEFILILFGASLQDAFMRLQRTQQEINKAQLYFQGHALPKITISIGIAEAPTHGTTVEEIILAADEALYHAKSLGRDRIQLFESMVSHF